MSAKKSTKRAANKAVSPPAVSSTSKITTKRAEKVLNPLPADVVGPRLLVRLKAEKVIVKLRLKEHWEDPNGWRFENLCALIASEMGDGWLLPGEKQLLKAVNILHKKSQINAIKKAVTLKFIDAGGGVVSVLPETFEEYLILGLGTPMIPIPMEKNISDTEQLRTALALLLDVSEDAIKPRTFERAKRTVKERFAKHLAKEEVRGRHRPERPVQPKLQRRSEVSLLREVFGQITVQGKLAGKASLDLSVQAALMKVGIKMPNSG